MPFLILLKCSSKDNFHFVNFEMFNFSLAVDYLCCGHTKSRKHRILNLIFLCLRAMLKSHIYLMF